MTEPIRTDVLVVGAGPTGLSLACQFVRHGVDFVAVEKNEGVTPYSKAIGVHARTLEIYEQMASRARPSSRARSRGGFDCSRAGSCAASSTCRESARG